MYDGDGHVVARHGQADPTERDDDGRNLTDRENPGHRWRQGENYRREFVIRSNLFFFFHLLTGIFSFYRLMVGKNGNCEMIVLVHVRVHLKLFDTYRTRVYFGPLP